MKKIISIILTCMLMISFTVSAFAVGDGNLDGGGGSMGSGTSTSYWNSGNDGVRVTVIRESDNAVITVPIDLTNKTISSSYYHFGKVSKISYVGGFSLNAVQGGYTSVIPAQAVPTIVSSSGATNISAIKSYFTDEQVIRSICNITGMSYDTLIGGEYRLLLEPLVFFKFLGADVVMTATEAAMYDLLISGQLRSNMASLTHKNLPLSMFLETSDMGFPAWYGSTTSTASNSNIKSSLGLGIVRFTDDPTEPEDLTYDYIYRTNTQVITSLDITGGQSDPDNPVTVTFNISGTSYNVSNVYYPSGDSQLAWVKWTTPAEEQDMTIYVTTSGPSTTTATLNIQIVDMDLNPPPNPVADDRNDTFSLGTVPTREEQNSLSWNVWSVWWQEFWVDRGSYRTSTSTSTDSEGNTTTTTTRYWVANWVDEGWWEFDSNSYYASLSASMDITTDSYNPTGTSSVFKSGYGVNQSTTARVTTNNTTAVSTTPNAISYFPEFNYEGFWRLLDRTSSGTSSVHQFKTNVYSTYNNRTHFSPIWFPDGAYTVNTHLIDYWCPSGMLSANLTDTLNVSGNLWTDWHIGPKDNG